MSCLIIVVLSLGSTATFAASFVVPSAVTPMPGQERSVRRFFTSLQGWTKRPVTQRPKVVIALDVDGTCAELNADPKAVRIKPSLIREVKRLQTHGVTVVFITGRSGSEIGTKPGQVYGELLAFERYTDHGAVVWGVGPHAKHRPTHHRVRRAQSNLARLQPALQRGIRAELAARVGAPEANRLLQERLEQKDYGFALHWRGLSAPHVAALRQAAERAWSQLPTSQRKGLQFDIFGNVSAKTPQRDGIELRIAEVTKGDAIRDLKQRHRLHRKRSLLLFAGDSGTDENGFAALKTHFATGNALGVRVDANPQVKTAATARVKSPTELGELLTQLRQLVESP